MPSTYFDAVKITKGKFTPVSGTAIDLGCTGSLSGSTEVRKVTKKCEGADVAERTVPLYSELTFSGHLFVEAYRALFGLAANATITTQYEYGINSKNAVGSFEWTVESMDGSEEKVITFPNATVNTGFVYNYENGLEEIAESELTIKAMPDENGVIYHEDISDVTP